MDYCKYVNVFHGCGEITPKKPEGVAAKWFFIKAGCGNTSPAATVPFGAVSVGPYSGGYPTGYGDHYPNSHSRPPRFPDGKKLYGFAHLQQSGTGAIGYYYNYAVVTPRYTDSPELRLPTEETAEPGYYSAKLEDIFCELTTNGKCAFHRYTFTRPGGSVAIDFSNNGLRIPGADRAKSEILSLEKSDDATVLAKVKLEGVLLHFAVRSNTAIRIAGLQATTTQGPDVVTLQVAISPASMSHAIEKLSNADFDDVRLFARSEWNRQLSKIRIQTKDPEILEIFYSNLYHSLVKPSDWSGDSFLYDTPDAFVADLNTLWDMYKTAMPLIFLLDRKMGEKTTETLLRLGEVLGSLPNSIGISDDYLNHSDQARMLAEYVLFTALRYGYPIDRDRLMNVIEKDVFAESKKDFTCDGKCKSNTFVLDMADGCAIAAEYAEKWGYSAFAEKLKKLAVRWKDAYDVGTGLLKDEGEYYEGTLYNYSFRQMVEMNERICLAGGKERFVRLLDRFFGYGAEDTVQPTDPMDYSSVAEGMKLGRFEGFNNESDLEAPFSYIFADRHDRTCEIIRGGMEYMFTAGPGGIPGNNDTGALSSYYVFAALGLFPVAGQNLFLIGSPFVDKAEVTLYNGNELRIRVKNNAKNNIYVQSVRFNGKQLNDFRLTAENLLAGGELVFEMTDIPNTERKTENV